MTSVGFVLALTLFLQVQNPAQTAPPAPTVVDVLRATLKAIEKADSVEYEVRRVARNPEDQDAKLRTTILATQTPFQFYSKTIDENGQVVGLAVSEGKTTRTSASGKVGENPTFTKDGSAMIATIRSSEDMAITRELFNPGYLNEAIASQRIMLVGQAEIEGELCHVIFYARPSTRPGIMTKYIWVSTVTGLPRAVQTLNFSAGLSLLAPRLVVSKVRLSPAIPAETFSYQPKASDSVAAPAAKPAGAEPASKPASAEPASVIGKQLPDLEARDVEFKAVKLTDFKGRPALITFWASWCSPCVGEMPTLQKLLDEYKGKLQVLALAVQEERRSSLQFIKDHPQYKFVFLTEPTPGEGNTPLQAFFNIVGIPVGAFVDAEGKIQDHWFGFKSEKEFVERISRLMGQQP